LANNPFKGKRALSYDSFFETPFGRKVKRLEGELLLKELEDFKEGELLEVGCGTGIWMKFLVENGFREPTGLDISEDMLRVARKKGLRKLVRGTGTLLPFRDSSFDASLFITSLEFMVDRKRALLEAARVSKKAVIVGFLNGHSLMNLVRRVRSFFTESSYSAAKFLTVDEIERMARWVGAVSNLSLRVESFRTTLNFSIDGFVNQELERKLGFNLPFGAFGLIKFKVIRRNGAGKGS